MAIRENYDTIDCAPLAEGLSVRLGIAQDGKPSEKQLEVQKHARDLIAGTAFYIEQYVEDGREKSLALTKLEEALMWAGKAIFKP